MHRPTVVLVHGAFVTYRSWDRWVARFERRGHACLAIRYPGRDRPVAELKDDLDSPLLGALTLPQVIEHIEGTIRALPEPPIIIGHSFGGLLTQLMLQRGLGAAGVAIDSVPPQGVFSLEWSFLRSLWPVLTPFVRVSSPYYMSFEHFQYSFANALPLEDQRAGYEADIVPESRRFARAGLSRHARVEFARERAPLLLIGGEEDHIIPASLNRTNFRRYRKTPSTTEFKEFAGRSHYSVIAGPGWEQVADYALDWALRKAERAPSAGAVGTAAADPVPWDGAVEPTATAAPRTAPDALA
jgi:pimeloyl-ACP methyl ester carboxylesterase